MSGAHSWNVKGIDPKVREAAREAAARQGMSLGEYLSQALQNHQPSGAATLSSANSASAPRLRSQRFATSVYEDEEDDWTVSGPTHLPRGTDPVRLSQRIEAIERRTQLAVAGLDRAVSTIDRSVLGLAARIEDAESASVESAERVANALEQFRIAGDTLSGRLEQTAHELNESRNARERLENQVALAEEIARRAEAAANFLGTELENRDAAIAHKLGAVEDRTRDAIRQTLTQARAAAEEAARHASEASHDAVLELRRLQDNLAERLSETEHSTRRAIETAIEQTRSQHEQLSQRLAGAEFEARGAKDALVEEVVRLESEIGARIAAAEQLRAEQSALISRIEKAEANAREATAGLRQAAGAAIADLRNAQLLLATRVKQVEEKSGAAVDLTDIRTQQADIADRLQALEDQARASPMQEALARFEQRIAEMSARLDEPSSAHQRIEQVDGAVRTLDEALKNLATRIADTESSANTAIRTLEQTVSNLSARVENVSAAPETEKLRAMLEQRLDEMAQSVAQTVNDARSELAGQVEAVLHGAPDEGFESALADVNRRLAAAERRQAQTIEAISLEIKRMSESVDKRLRSVEARNDDAAASAVREELTRMSRSLEARFDEIERREAAAFDRMGLEVGRLSERIEERVGTVEARSAQAIEQVGEQVARMAERFNQRHEILARDLGERMLDSEERAGARVSDAIGSIMQRLAEVEERSTDAMAPVKKAVSSVASRLEALETGAHEPDRLEPTTIPTPQRRFEDVAEDPFLTEDFPHEAFAAPTHEPPPSPMEAAQPTRAAPLPPIEHPPLTTPETATPSLVEPEHDLYLAEEVEAEPPIADDIFHAESGQSAHATPPPLDLSISDHAEDLIEDAFLDDHAFAPPPPEDEDPFWTPDTTPDRSVASTVTSAEPIESAPAKPGKNDYLNAARKAAQAQSAPKNKKDAKTAFASDEVPPTPIYSLRGSSRIVLWGAASALALLIAGGAWYLNAREEAAHTQPPPPPQTPPPAPQQTAAAPATSDAVAPADATTAQDPFGAAPTDAAGSTPAAPSNSATTPQAAPQSAAPAVASTAPVVAGPLARRNVSLEQAAAGGDAVAQYELGLQRIAAHRNADALQLLRQSADHGLAMAQYRLAKMYERGEGVPTDLTTARQWTERAAAAGNRRAMHDLGVYFARGEGAPLDESAAFRWFRQAAELGVADSQFNLGVLYQQGRGVGASASEAEFWFLVAARQGDEDAAARAQALQTQLNPTQVDQARSRAEAFRPRAASAIANGEFGPRPWSTAAQRPAA